MAEQPLLAPRLSPELCWSHRWCWYLPKDARTCMGLQPRVDQQAKALYLLTSTIVSQKAGYENYIEKSTWQCPFHIAQTVALLSNAFVAICMLLPTMPSALMLLHLGSLSNLMMTNTAVFLICSLPKLPNNYFLGKKVICPPLPFFFFLTLKRFWRKEMGEW